MEDIDNANPEFQWTTQHGVEINNTPMHPDPTDEETFGYSRDDSVSTIQDGEAALQKQLVKATKRTAAFVQRVRGTSALISPVLSLTPDMVHTVSNLHPNPFAPSLTSVSLTLDGTADRKMSLLESATSNMEHTMEENSVMLNTILHHLDKIFTGTNTSAVDTCTAPQNENEVVMTGDQYMLNTPHDKRSE